MNINEVFQKICENPENDDLRLEYARLIEPSDPDHAELIRFQIEVTADRRQGTRIYGLETTERHLLEKNRIDVGKRQILSEFEPYFMPIKDLAGPLEHGANGFAQIIKTVVRLYGAGFESRHIQQIRNETI